MKSQREVALWVWEQAYGMPYIWGGDDAVEGYDCSGLVIEGLQAAGILPRKGDWRARDLAAKFSVREFSHVSRGDLVCFGDPITHIEIVWHRESLYNRDIGREPMIWTLGASGGDSETLTREDAIRDNAFVKVRPLESLGRPMAFRNPFEGAP